MHNKVIAFIDLLKYTLGSYPTESGGCLKFAFVLKSVFEADIYYNSNHCITLIDGKYYDINGVVENAEGYLPIESFGARQIQESFSNLVHSRLIKKFIG